MNTKFSVEQTSQLSIHELEHALKIAAKVVAMYGDVYLPIFSRVQNDLTKAMETDKMKTLALQMANSYSENG